VDYLLLQMLNGVQLGPADVSCSPPGLDAHLRHHGISSTLAHGSLYMMGAYIAWTLIGWTDSFLLGALLALPAHLSCWEIRGRGRRHAPAFMAATISTRLLGDLRPDPVLQRAGCARVWGPAGKSIAVPSFPGAHRRDPAGRAPTPPTVSPSS